MNHKVLTQEDEVSILGPEKDIQFQIRPVQQQVYRRTNYRAESLIGLVTQQIESEIYQSQIIISEKTRPFGKNSLYIKKNDQTLDGKKISEFVKKRKNLEQQMLRLKLETQEQKKKSRSKSPNATQHQKTFRSNFTTKQQLEISHILKKSEQFEQKIQSHQKKLLQKIEEQRLRSNEWNQVYLQNLKQKKKQESLKKIEKIQQQQKLRVQKLKFQNKRYKQVKNTKTLHEKIEQHQKALQDLKKQKQVQMMKQKRKSMILDVEQIKAHQKKYYETVRITKEKLQNQFMQRVQKMKENQVRQAENYRPSKFLLTVWHEEKSKQIEERQRIEKMKLLFSRKNSFEQKVREAHKQKIRKKAKEQMKKSIVGQKVQDHRLKVKSMSAADIYKQGQDYMKSVHSSISPSLIGQSKVEIQNNSKLMRQGGKTEYRNYLHQKRLSREQQYQSTGKLIKRKISNPEMNQLQSIMGSKKQTEVNKLYRAKIIAQKLDKKAKNSSTAALVDSITAKLKIIQEFS